MQWLSLLHSLIQYSLNSGSARVQILLVTLHKKMKLSIQDFINKCDQICSFLQIWSHLLKKSLMESFIFCAVWESPTTIQTVKKPHPPPPQRKGIMQYPKFATYCYTSSPLPTQNIFPVKNHLKIFSVLKAKKN